MGAEPRALGFGRAAAEYEHGRPEWPDEPLDLLTRELALEPAAHVVDLAAGTGKLTRLLTATGATVIAVEPVDEMRDTLRRTTPEAEAHPGTAERTGLPDASADAVMVAQAFHWFDGPAALAEIHRCLKPGGKLTVIYNVRDLDDAVQRAVDDLLAPYRRDTPSHRDGQWRASLTETNLFGTAVRREFRNVQTLDADGLVRRIASTSFIADLPEPERRRVLDRAAAIAAALPDRFPFPYTTDIEIFERLGA